MPIPHIMIIGAGAAGLMAANELARSGRKITLLEARDRVGGRMHTIIHSKFDKPAEAGAEFIHGDLPITKSLLNTAGIGYLEMEGGFYETTPEGLKPMQGTTEEDGLVFMQLNSLEEDITVAQFFDRYLPDDKHAETRAEIQGFVEGFDSGDIADASAFTLRDEMQARDEVQYRIEGGYIKLVDFLAQQCREAGVEIVLQQQVTDVHWEEGKASLRMANGQTYEGDAVLITVPLSILHSDIQFHPAIPKHIGAAKEIGYGRGVIKVLMQFDAPFWQDIKGAKDLSFLFSGGMIPTFWTQYPTNIGLLVGWLCGPKAADKKHWKDEAIFVAAMESLSAAFHTSLPDLQKKLQHYEVHNWAADPFTKGAYAYATVDGTQQREILRTPIANTLFFAGEGLYIGDHNGTVEAALESALYVVQQILTAPLPHV